MRLIDADALHTHKFLTPQVKVIGGRHNGKTREQIIEAYQKGWNDCLDAIVDNAPSVDAVVNTIEVRPKGKWIDSEAFKRKVYRCSLCNEVSLMPFYNFCPSCGADMRKGGAE